MEQKSNFYSPSFGLQQKWYIWTVCFVIQSMRDIEDVYYKPWTSQYIYKGVNQSMILRSISYWKEVWNTLVTNLNIFLNIEATIVLDNLF